MSHTPAVRVVTVTAEELAALVEAAVRRALAEVAATANPTAGDWLDAGESADLLGVHRRTIGKLVKAGTLRASRIGKLYRIRRGDVEAMLAKRPNG